MQSSRYTRFASGLAIGLLFGICLPVRGDTPDSLWGADRGCLQGQFTRDKPMSEKARRIEPIDQDHDFSFQFRFRTLGRGSYAATVYLGLRRSGCDWNVDGLGASIFRHNDKIGLIAAPFLCDNKGESHQPDESISLDYDSPYDVFCEYFAATKSLKVRICDAVTGDPVGKTCSLRLPDDVKWSADRLACWNHADGHSPNMRLTVLIDRLQLDDAGPLVFASDLSGLPLGADRRFTHYRAPLPQLITKLTAPREVLAGEDVGFEAEVQKGLTGSVRFSLKAYWGEAVWSERAQIMDGRASVVLTGAEAAKLDKGSRVLVATVNRQADRTACVPVRLRGRIFRNVTEAPAAMMPGDEILLDEMSLLQPSDEIAEQSVKGKWWLRQYTVPDEAERRSMVTVEEQDLEEPASCVAAPLRLPLRLSGWYQVWVRTHQPAHSPEAANSPGGIDVRLSGQRCFWHAGPLDAGSVPGGTPAPDGNLVDVFYRAADLNGQDLVFQQPYGTYPSDTKHARASLAGVRLVKLSDDQVVRLQAERKREDSSIIGYDNDGFSYFWKWGVHDPDCIARLMEPLRDGSTAFFNIELGGLGGLTIPTPYTGMYQMSSGHVRDGDLRANAFFRWCFENDVHVLNQLLQHAHSVELKVFASVMMERCFCRDETMRAHSDWRIRRGRGTWDYALEDVQDYQVKKIAWIIENHELDGFIVDFTRYGHFFNEDEPNKFVKMNGFLRKLRGAVDEINARKQRQCLFAASFGDRSWHLKHWGSGVLADQGLDVTTWLDEGLFDIIMPEGLEVERFVEMGAGSRTRVWPRKVANVTLRTHDYDSKKLSPKEIEREAKWAFDQGAEGVFFFNHETCGSLRRLGFKEELDLRTRVDEVYGYREGPAVTFTGWYPSLEERAAQRAVFRPLTIELETEGRVDGDLVVPIRNVFSHPVTATVEWSSPVGEGAREWTVTPAGGSVEIASGEEQRLTFHLAGTAIKHNDVPTAKVELSANRQILLRHRVPLRAVGRMVSREVRTAPTIDGDLSDSAWAEAGGLRSETFFLQGSSNGAPWKTEMAVAYDRQNLYVAYRCSGVEAVGGEPMAAGGEALNVLQSDHVQILLDPAANERAYLGFVATPDGGQTNYRAYYDDFAGQFRHDRDWRAKWQVAAVRGKDAYCIEVAIPFSVLGTAPKAGDVWRLNLVARSEGADAKGIVASWTSPESPFHLPRHFGTLHGCLVFAERAKGGGGSEKK